MWELHRNRKDDGLSLLELGTTAFGDRAEFKSDWVWSSSDLKLYQAATPGMVARRLQRHNVEPQGSKG